MAQRPHSGRCDTLSWGLAAICAYEKHNFQVAGFPPVSETGIMTVDALAALGLMVGLLEGAARGAGSCVVERRGCFSKPYVEASRSSLLQDT